MEQGIGETAINPVAEIDHVLGNDLAMETVLDEVATSTDYPVGRIGIHVNCSIEDLGDLLWGCSVRDADVGLTLFEHPFELHV